MTRQQRNQLIRKFNERVKEQGLHNIRHKAYGRELSAFFAGAMMMDHIITGNDPDVGLFFSIIGGRDISELIDPSADTGEGDTKG